ncbi:unnamed protein product [Agarophyton chilense]
MKPWNHCALSLAIASDPVLTPQGVLYDREAILLNLLHQKKTAKSQLDFQRAEQLRVARENAARHARQQAQLEKNFVDTQQTLHERPKEDNEPDVHEEQRKTNFWLPGDHNLVSNVTSETELRPVKRRKMDKSALRTVCPITQAALKSRDLISLKLTRVKKEIRKKERDEESGGEDEDEDEDEDDAEERDKRHQTEQDSASLVDDMFMCPVCQAVLVNASKPIALRTGTVLCAKCVDQFVLKSARDPVTDVKVDLKTDVIRIHNSGTGFVASTPDDCASKEAKLYRPSVR